MRTKAPVGKTAKDAQQTKSLKPGKKTVKKNTRRAAWDEIEEGFKKLQKSQDEAWAAIRETQQAHKETEKAMKETHESIFGLNKARDEAWAAIKENQKNIFGFNKARDEAWAAIRETQQAHKETEKAMKETHESIFGLNKARDEAWAAIRETQQAHKETEKAIKETEKAIKETQKNIGGLGNTLGSIVEHLLTPGLPKKFKMLGFSFNRIVSYKFEEGVYAQIDGMLENGEQAVAVEVKTTLRREDIDKHLLRMEKIRKHADEHSDKRKFMGAMAATIIDDNTRNYALDRGLFVIEPSGDDVKVTKPEGEVKVW